MGSCRARIGRLEGLKAFKVEGLMMKTGVVHTTLFCQNFSHHLMEANTKHLENDAKELSGALEGSIT